MGTYLQDHPPRIRQYRPRGRRPTGCIVVHTAESAPDTVGDDSGALGVARFIQSRDTYGSYHVLADSDSTLPVVPFDQAAYGDGTGSNSWAIHISAATQAARWPSLPDAWVDGCLRQLARAAAQGARWLLATHGITVPARRITRAQSEAGEAGFISHGERDPGRRSDPGPAFPWDRFLAYYAAEMQEDDMASPEVRDQLDRIEQTGKQLLQEQRAGRQAQTKRNQETRAHLRRVAAQAREGRKDVRELAAELEDLVAQLDADEQAETARATS